MHSALLYILYYVSLDSYVIAETGHCAGMCHLSRAEYVHQAIPRMNRDTEQKALGDRLATASKKARGESTTVNTEFAEVEHDLD